MGKVK